MLFSVYLSGDVVCYSLFICLEKLYVTLRLFFSSN